MHPIAFRVVGASIGFFAGIGLVAVLDRVVPKLKDAARRAENHVTEYRAQRILRRNVREQQIIARAEELRTSRAAPKKKARASTTARA